METVERKRKKRQNIEYLKNEKSFVEEIKSIVHNFYKTFFWWNTKKQKTETLNFNTQIHINVDLV